MRTSIDLNIGTIDNSKRYSGEKMDKIPRNWQQKVNNSDFSQFLQNTPIFSISENFPQLENSAGSSLKHVAISTRCY